MTLPIYARSRRPVSPLGQALAYGVFVIAGIVGIIAIGHMAEGEYATWSWTPTPCRWVDGRVHVVDAAVPFHVSVAYSYDWAGQQFNGTQFVRDGDLAFDNYADADHLVESWRSRPPAICYVDPGHPSDAVIQRGNLFFALWILPPLLFVVVGVRGIFVLRRRGSHQLLFNTSPFVGRVIVMAFSLIFLGSRTALLFAKVIPALGQYLGRDQWRATPCNIVLSEVGVQNDNRTVNRVPQIVYSYAADGREYYSNQYRFIAVATNFGADMGVVNSYPAGSEQTCYVNPADPYQAVLIRDLGWQGAMLFFPLPFIAIGGFLLFWSVFASKKRPGAGIANAGNQSQGHGHRGGNRKHRV